jgi:DNA-binding LacI/PurR family transcriptional regulator
MKTLLKIDPLPTAVIAVSDSMALGAMQTIKEAGLHIPQDISVVGFNNAPFTGMVDPPLTTVDAPLYQLGQTGAKILHQLIEGSTSPPRTTILPTSLITRQSTGEHRASHD